MLAAPQTAPGVYPGPNLAPLLRANEQQYLFQQQLVQAGQASIAVQFERLKGASYPFGASMEMWFTDVNGNPSTPGAFEVDWQNADIDAAVHYVTMQALVGTASLNASFVGRIELPTMWTKYSRALVKTLPNPVYVSILVTR